MTRKKYLLLLLLPLFLWGCETLPFRLGGSLDGDDAITQSSNATPTETKKAASKAVASKPKFKRVLVKRYYKVRKGDSIYRLARKYKMKPANLAKMNGLKLTDKLKIGQRITVTKTITKRVVTKNKDGITLPKKQAAVKESNLASGKSSRFIWPIQKGKLLQKFGKGVSQDGIVLGGAVGQNIAAVAGGQVIYVGTDIKPLGLLVLVKHANGFVSTYGHLQKSLVKKGHRVKQGQPIASLGQSGNAGQPQLYFEIRKNNRPSNPRRYLP